MNKAIRLALGVSLSAVFGGTACSSSDGTTTLEPHPTVIEVDPEQFLPAENCVDARGGVRLYQATLTDADGGFELPSSELVPCARSVAFGSVVPGRSYDLTIRAFDREDLVLLAPGVPIVLTRDEPRQPVLPRWETKCEATRAEAAVTQRVVNCKEGLLNGDTSTTPDPTAIEVGILGGLGETVCGEGENDVSSFVVRRDGTQIGQAACGELVLVDGVSAGEFVELEVQAFAAGATTAALGGICATTAVAGVTLPARCSPFHDQGAVRVEAPALLELAGARCDANLGSLVVTLDGGEASLSFNATTCALHGSFSALAPGVHALDVTIAVTGAMPITLHCTATVEPGLAAKPVCDPI